MSLLPTGAERWVDSMARFPGGLVNGTSRGGPSTHSFDVDLYDNVSSAISDIAEEGEIGPASEGSHANASPVDLVAEEIDASSTDMGLSQEIVAALAMHLGKIEAAMRQHQATGVINFDDAEADSGDEDPGDRSFHARLLLAMLKSPRRSWASINQKKNRAWIMALLHA